MNARTSPCLTAEELARVQQACRIAEHDLEQGIHSAAKVSSPAIAMAVLVANLRRNMGAGETFPSSADLDHAVAAQLRDWGLLKDELGRPA